MYSNPMQLWCPLVMRGNWIQERLQIPEGLLSKEEIEK